MRAAASDLWRCLADAGLVQGERPPVPLEPPWFVRLLLGFAGWLAALFLLGFVSTAMSWLLDSEMASIVAGLLLCGAAWLMFRTTAVNAFATQFALALSFAGQALFALGVFGTLGRSQGLAEPWLWVALQQAVLLAVMPSAVHRLWSAFAAATALYLALRDGAPAFLAPALMLAAAAWAWLHELRWPRISAVLRPAAYGLVLALIFVELAAGLFRPAIGLDATPPGRRTWGQLLNGAVLLAVVWVLLRRSGVRWPGKASVTLLAGALVVVLVSLAAPGIAAGTCLLLLGYAHGNAVLAGLGGAALLLYAAGYYYELDVTLLVKSQALAATGAALLALRWVLLRWLPGNRRGRPDD